MNICHFCGNSNFKDTVCEYTYKRDGRMLFVENVPCRKCGFCGEQYFLAENLKKIEAEFEAIHYHGKKATGEIVVPTQHFADITSVP